MRKVTLDTNVIISSIFWQNESYKMILLAEEKKIEIFGSEFIIEEVKEVINSEEKFQEFLENKEKAVEELINNLLNRITIIETKTKINTIKEHEEDNRILECAIDSNSEYLISYNKHILNNKLEIEKLYKIKVMTPTEFLRINSS